MKTSLGSLTKSIHIYQIYSIQAYGSWCVAMAGDRGDLYREKEELRE